MKTEKMMEINKVICGDALREIKTFPSGSINCIITSPPYYQQRDYGFIWQYGQEKTYQEYLSRMQRMMDEFWRILTDDGCVFINMGDKYQNDRSTNAAIKYKSLMGIPQRFMINCIDNGWILRNNIIWAKNNAMPSPAADRFSNKHESVFFFTKSSTHYFDLDAIKDERLTNENRPDKHERERLHGYKIKEIKKKSAAEKITEKIAALRRLEQRAADHPDHFWDPPEIKKTPDKKNPGDVTDFWIIGTQPSTTIHIASYNFNLIDKPILAGCPKDGIVLDPFCGIGTTLLRAIDHGRRYIGIDGNPKYLKIFEDLLHERYGFLRDHLI